MDIIYRLSTNSYVKPKFPNATKEHCLENAVRQFGDATFHVFVDQTNLTQEGLRFADEITRRFNIKHLHFHKGGSSAGSWRVVFEYVMTGLFDLVYFLEDDYLHLPNSDRVLMEGLQLADYVSLYDHNDKYIPGVRGGDPFIDVDGGEETKVFRTKSTHWKLTNSTTMTFATTVAQLRQDRHIWEKHTLGKHPNDFQAFLELREAGRSLVTPIPGYSTHCEPRWASPGTDWTQV